MKGKARNIDHATEILVQVGKTQISDKLLACPIQLPIVTFELLCLGVTTCLVVSPYNFILFGYRSSRTSCQEDNLWRLHDMSGISFCQSNVDGASNF